MAGGQLSWFSFYSESGSFLSTLSIPNTAGVFLGFVCLSLLSLVTALPGHPHCTGEEADAQS